MQIYATDPLFAWVRLEDPPQLATLRRLLEALPDQALQGGRDRTDSPVSLSARSDDDTGMSQPHTRRRPGWRHEEWAYRGAAGRPAGRRGCAPSHPSSGWSCPEEGLNPENEPPGLAIQTYRADIATLRRRGKSGGDSSGSVQGVE